MQGTGLGPKLPLWSLHSNGGSKAVNYCKINNLSMLGTVALRGKEC